MPTGWVRVLAPGSLIALIAVGGGVARAAPPGDPVGSGLSDRPLRSPSLVAAAASSNTYLVEAARLYNQLEYERALEQLAMATAKASSRAEIAMISMYRGIVYSDTPGKGDASTAAFRYALRHWPQAQLPATHPRLMSAFEDLRKDVAREGLSPPDLGRPLNSYLVDASRLCEQLEYEKALAQLANARAHAPSQAELAMISLYEGVVFADIPGKHDEAMAAFSNALKLWPQARLPVTSPKTEREFEDLRKQYEPKREAQAPTRVSSRREPEAALVPRLTGARPIHEESPWFPPWYVWAGVGVAAAAITGVAVIAGQPQAPCPGGTCDFCINAPSSSFCH